MRQDLTRVRLIAALAVVPLLGLMLFIAALDLVFHVNAMLDGIASRSRARRVGYLRLQP